MKNIIATFAAAFLLLASAAHAQQESREPVRIGGPEANIKRLIESRLPQGAVVDAVTRTPFFGLFEVRIGSEIVYTDEKVTYIFNGSVLDGKTMENLTQERINRLSMIKFDDLPLAASIRQVNGNGRRRIAYFADPNCGYCKKFEREALMQIKDATIHIFIYPILSQDSVVKARSVWCSADRLKAWNDWMLKNTAPTAAGSCENPIDSIQALGQRLRINGTPTMFLANGRRLTGAVPLAQLEAAIADAAK